MEVLGNYNINKSKEFYSSFNHYLMDSSNEIYWKFFNEKKHRLSSDQISSRVISHWEKVGLINIQRENRETWRRYSLMDIIWLSLIYELRGFKFGLEQIKKVKNSLISSYNQCEYGELEFYSALAYKHKSPVEVLVFNETFKGEVSTIFEIDDNKQETGLLSHLSISLNGILQRIFYNKDLKPLYSSNYIDLSGNEMIALNKLRSGKYKSLAIHYSHGEMQMIEGEAIDTKETNISNLLQEADFQEIIIKQENGKISFIKRTEKHKL